MVVKIEFFKDYKESTLPIVRLTKSRNKITGTATFIFIRPLLFELMQNQLHSLTKMSLIWENKSIVTYDLNIIFYKGKPFLMKAIFLFKNPGEWYQFLNFMQFYCKETGLSFTEFQS
jgi:photosystem II protein